MLLSRVLHAIVLQQIFCYDETWGSRKDQFATDSEMWAQQARWTIGRPKNLPSIWPVITLSEPETSTGEALCHTKSLRPARLFLFRKQSGFFWPEKRLIKIIYLFWKSRNQKGDFSCQCLPQAPRNPINGNSDIKGYQLIVWAKHNLKFQGHLKNLCKHGTWVRTKETRIRVSSLSFGCCLTRRRN